MNTERKTFLFIRSSSVSHCVQSFAELKRHPEHSAARWIWIIQPGVVESFRGAWQGTEIETWAYDRGAFRREAMEELFLSRLKGERIEAAYIPFNHPDGAGYSSIIGFLHGAGARRIYALWPDQRVEAVTPFQYAKGQFIDGATSFVASVVLLVSIPLIILYYLCLYALMRARTRLKAA